MNDQVNIPLLRKAVEWAEAEAAKPEREREWDQGYWVTLPVMRAAELGLDEAQCGTVYCIAGWTCHAAGEDFKRDSDTLLSRTAEDVHISDRAAELLGIDRLAASALFNGGNTIEDVRRIAEEIAGERL
jgi:hypothetical protein